MKLSSIQAKIVNAMILDAGADLTDVAKQLRVTPKAARYHRDFLVRSGIVSEQSFIDLYPLGYRYVNLYFAVAPCPRERLAKLIAYFVAHPRVTWMAELGGEFHYGVAFLVRDVSEFQEELGRLPSEIRELIDRKSVTVHQSLTLFRLKVLGGVSVSAGCIGYGGPASNVKIDEIDRELLRITATEPTAGVRDLAKRLGRSASAVSDRISALKKAGIIQGKWLRANFEALGLTSYKLIVFTHGLDVKDRERFRRLCLEHHCVDHLIECVADWEFEVGLVVTTYSQVMETVSDCATVLGSAARSVKIVPLLSVLKLEQVPSGFPIRSADDERSVHKMTA